MTSTKRPPEDEIPAWVIAALRAEHGDLPETEQAAQTAWTILEDFQDCSEVAARLQAARDVAARSGEDLSEQKNGHVLRGWLLRPAVGMAASLAAMVGIGGWLAWQHAQPDVYETPAGQQLTVTLQDNSRIVLDQNTRVTVTYSRHARDLHLVAGQAEFDVAKDHARPFSVTAAGHTVIATGTLFNIDVAGAHLAVSLLRGGVLVTSPHGGQILRLRPMERLDFAGNTMAPHKSTFDASDVEAWQMGKLIFDDEPLRQAIARVNRYARRPVVLSATDQADAPVTGVFNIGDGDAFARAVEAQLPVRMQVHGDEVILLPRLCHVRLIDG